MGIVDAVVLLIVTVIAAWLLASFFRGRQELKPQVCMCGHGRHFHKEGHKYCQVCYGISEEFPKGSMCACDVFIPKPTTKPPTDNSAKELEKMLGM
jgi:hypothetical protein